MRRKSLMSQMTLDVNDMQIMSVVGGQVTVAQGFKPPSTFDASTSGSGNLFLQLLNVGSISLTNNGWVLIPHEALSRLVLHLGICSPFKFSSDLSPARRPMELGCWHWSYKHRTALAVHFEDCHCGQHTNSKLVNSVELLSAK